MMVPRKPHPFGNKYHTIACGLSRIIFGFKLVEGEDEPDEKPADLTNQHGKTVGLLLRMCESLYHTGKVVVLDSGFCVLRGLVELQKNGVYAAAVIKKRRYWPRFVDGDWIDDGMKDKEVGDVGVLSGKLAGVDFNIFCMKEPAWNMKLMSTYYGDTETPSGQEKTRRFYKDATGTTIRRQFLYTTLFSNHFLYRHAVDDHNNLRHKVPSLEETWTTSRWLCRVLCFMMAVVEINAYLAFRFFVWRNDPDKTPTLHQFRRTLALELIYNEYLKLDEMEGQKKRKRGACDHALLVAPPHACNFVAGKWNKSAKDKYQQYVCRTIGCPKRVRTYCSCGVGRWMCQICFRTHLIDVVTTDEGSD